MITANDMKWETLHCYLLPLLPARKSDWPPFEPCDRPNFCLPGPGHKTERCVWFRLHRRDRRQRGDATDENVPGMCCEKVSVAAERIVVRAEVAVAAAAS